MTTVKATHIVQPSEATTEEIMYLNSGDQIKDITHTPTIYFYKHSAVLDATDVLPRLKDSLGRALVPFYPMAGRLRLVEGGGGRVELHCNGRGVPVFEAVSEAAVEDLGDFCPTPAMEAFVPVVDYTAPIDEIPMAVVQLTRFRCGGGAIGLGISHVIADGPSGLHFVNEWAKISRVAAEPIVPPFLDRRILEVDVPPASAYDATVLRPLPTVIGEDSDVEQRKKPIAVALLTLTKPQIEKLRSKADVDLGGGRGCSRFEAIAAHIWRCTSKARRHAADQQTSLCFVADFRNKLNPPLPKNYFGNALIRVEATDKSGSLLSNTIGAAARKIREAVEKVTDESVRSYLHYLKELPEVGSYRRLDNGGGPSETFFGNPNFGIVSWTALPLQGADFGWGKEVSVGPGPMTAKIEMALIVSGHGGDASVNIPVWLQEQHMEDFKKCFYEDI